MRTLLTAMALAAVFTAHANPTFFVTQITSNSSSKLYRFGLTGSSYTELRNLDVYNLGQTGIAVLDPVPEPATLAALGIGAIGILARRRRRVR